MKKKRYSNTEVNANGEFTLNRRSKILELLETDGNIKVNKLSDFFKVSDVTIRNDLSRLEKKGLLIRTRGGGIKAQPIRIDYQFNKESKLHSNEKRLIGKKAAELIVDGDTIIIDGGSTTLELARNIPELGSLTVITNAINIASLLVSRPFIKVIMLGGNLRSYTLSVMGPLAEATLKNIYCDKIFLGINGIESKHGISNTYLEDAHLTSLMIKSSKNVIVLTDSSKFLRRSFAAVASIQEINTLITDSGIPPEEEKNLHTAGVRTIIV